MFEQFGKDLLDYLWNHWIHAGIACGLVCTYLTAKNKLNKEGFVTIGEFLLGVFYMAVYIAAGWLGMFFLGMLLKDEFEQLLRLKLFTTKEYKTKNLLYKQDEDHD